MFPIAASALQHVDPFPLTAIRYGVAVIVFLGLLDAVEGRRALEHRRPRPELFILGSLGFAGFNLLSYVGLEHTRPQDAALIVASQPLLMALGAVADDPQRARRHDADRHGRRAARRHARDHPRPPGRCCTAKAAAAT